MSQNVVLLFLFVVLPVVLALVVAALVQWRAAPVDPSRRTSDVLRDGIPAVATLLAWRSPGQSFLERRPMVTFRVRVERATPFETEITQSVPRRALRYFEAGMKLQIRLSADDAVGAIVFPSDDDDS